MNMTKSRREFLAEFFSNKKMQQDYFEDCLEDLEAIVEFLSEFEKGKHLTRELSVTQVVNEWEARSEEKELLKALLDNIPEEDKPHFDWGETRKNKNLICELMGIDHPYSWTPEELAKRLIEYIN